MRSREAAEALFIELCAAEKTKGPKAPVPKLGIDAFVEALESTLESTLETAVRGARSVSTFSSAALSELGAQRSSSAATSSGANGS